MKSAYARRRVIALLMSVIVAGYIFLVQQTANVPSSVLSSELEQQYFGELSAIEVLNSLEVKGRAPKTNYSRSQFGDGWSKVGGCDTRNVILARDLTETVIDDRCRVLVGVLNDPYTGVAIKFSRGATTSDDVQIDHVVALSDAWQKGAQQISYEKRISFSNDPLNLLAVSGSANQQKGDGDAATWLPSNRGFRCQYVARQVAVKHKYSLWITQAEKVAISNVLKAC